MECQASDLTLELLDQWRVEAEQGNVQSQYALAWIYYHYKWDGKEDEALRYLLTISFALSPVFSLKLRLFKSAGEGGLGKAWIRYAQCLATWNLEEDRDYAEILKSYEKAAALGDAQGNYLAGEMYYEGENAPHDLPKAIELWKKSAELGYDRAQYGLGNLFLYARDEQYLDEENGRRWIKLAAEQGHSSAKYLLKQLSQQRGC